MHSFFLIPSLLLFVSTSFGSVNEKFQAFPPEIDHYYKIWNFISTYSTSDERRIIAEEKTLPMSISKDTARFKEIFRHAVKLKAYQFSDDPGIVGSTRLSRTLAVVNGISRIESLQRKGNTILVTVHSFSLSNEKNLVMIKSFPKTIKEESLKDTSNEIKPDKQYSIRTDTWKFDGLQWRVQDVSMQLVKN